METGDIQTSMYLRMEEELAQEFIRLNNDDAGRGSYFVGVLVPQKTPLPYSGPIHQQQRSPLTLQGIYVVIYKAITRMNSRARRYTNLFLLY